MGRLRPVLLLVAAALVGAGPGCRGRNAPTDGGGWGAVYDPVGDCASAADGGRLTLTVPGGNRNLNPAINLAAPRVLRPVEGDFVVSVRVTGEFAPGDRGVEVLPFNGAGLLVWQDDRNYVRVERDAYWLADRGRYFCYPPLVEYFRDGVHQATNPDPMPADDFFRGRSTHLRVDRRGSRLTASYSPDGREWVVAREFPVELAAQVLVGVVAVNTSTRPFAVAFDDFSVTPAR